MSSFKSYIFGGTDSGPAPPPLVISGTPYYIAMFNAAGDNVGDTNIKRNVGSGYDTIEFNSPNRTNTPWGFNCANALNDSTFSGQLTYGTFLMDAGSAKFGTRLKLDSGTSGYVALETSVATQVPIIDLFDYQHTKHAYIKNDDGLIFNVPDGDYSLRNEDNLIIAEIYQGRHSFCPAPPGSGTSWDAIISSFADQDALNNSGKINFLGRAVGLFNVMGMLFVTNNQVGDLEVTVPSSPIVLASTVVIMSGGITTGPLVVGNYYKIEAIDFSPLDDFSNVADVQSGVINTIGCIFIATGTTPTDWTHGTILLNITSETYSTTNSVTNKGTEVEFDFSTGVEIPEKYSFKFNTVTAFEIFSNKITAVLQTFAGNAAALTGGLVANDVYKTASGELRIVV